MLRRARLGGQYGRIQGKRAEGGNSHTAAPLGLHDPGSRRKDRGLSPVGAANQSPAVS